MDFPVGSSSLLFFLSQRGIPPTIMVCEASIRFDAPDHAFYYVEELIVHWMMSSYGVLAEQFSNVSPEAPPISGGIEKLVRWMMWFVQLSGISSMMYAGGRFGWDKWNGGALESPKMVAGAAIGGLTAAGAGTIMNAVMGV